MLSEFLKERLGTDDGKDTQKVLEHAPPWHGCAPALNILAILLSWYPWIELEQLQPCFPCCKLWPVFICVFKHTAKSFHGFKSFLLNFNRVTNAKLQSNNQTIHNQLNNLERKVKPTVPASTNGKCGMHYVLLAYNIEQATSASQVYLSVWKLNAILLSY